MRLDLLHPTKKLKSVDVGKLKFELLKLYSNTAYIHDYSLGARVLASICNSADFKDYLDISSVDALRIVRTAKSINANANVYMMKGKACSCGAMLLVAFDLKKDISPDEFYNCEHDFKGSKIKLKPDTVYDECFLLGNIQNKQIGQMLDSIMLARIESVDGKKFDLNDFDIEVVEWLQEVSAEQLNKYKELSETEVKCESCDLKSTFKIGLYDQDFLLKK